MENLKIVITDNAADNVIVSTVDKINVNRIDDNYVILFSPDTFESIHDNIAQVASTIVKMFNTNLPDKDIQMSIIIDIETIKTSCKFHETLVAFSNIAKHFNQFSHIQYIGCTDMNEDDDEIEDDEIEEDVDAEQEESADDIRNRLLSQIEAQFDNSSNDNDEYDDNDDDDMEEKDEFDFGYTNKMYNKNKHNKQYYGVSRVWKNSDNIKRSIKRHGVVVSDSKKDMKSDEKLIKAFLKDFIPGGADWKKEFRKELLERWMHCYVIEKKSLKKYQKKARKHARKKRSIDPNKAIEFTRRLFNTPIDKWADPNK